MIWKCSKCGNTVTADSPPEICPSCRDRCGYVDATCYISECRGTEPGNINQEVFGTRSDPDK